MTLLTVFSDRKIFIVDQEDNPLPRLLDHLSVALYNDVFAVN